MCTQGSLALMPHHMHDDGAYRYGSRTTEKLLMFSKDSEYLLVKLVNSSTNRRARNRRLDVDKNCKRTSARRTSYFGCLVTLDRFRPQYEVVSVLVLGPRLATKRAMLKTMMLATRLLQGAATTMWARSS